MSLALCTSLVGCGLLPVGSRPAPASSAAAPATGVVSGGEGASGTSGDDAEVRALVSEALAPQLCPRLLGSFLGLPGESALTGPAAGTVPSVGRWWIRSCDAQMRDGRIALTFGGPGWMWVDREASGFRVRQYLLFEGRAALGADVAVGYDRVRRVASLWMRPAEGVTASIVPQGMVSPEPTGLFSRLLGGVAAATGNSVSDRARTQAAEMGSTQLRERLATGFTMTLSLDTRQVDFMVGPLSRGQTPERPWPTAPGDPGPWLVNQRSTVWPGGLDVVGPFEPIAHGGLALDVALEEGEGAVVRAVCADDLTRYLDARLRDPAAQPAAPDGVAVVTLSAGGGAQRVALPNNVAGAQHDHACRVLLTVAVRPGSALPARLRYRVVPSGASTPAPVVTTAVSTGPRRVRLQLVGVTVRPTNADGRAWDLVGGEADPVVVTASVPLGRALDTTPLVSDRNDARWDRWLPGAFERDRDLPLRFTVYDDDATTRELIGTADLDARSLPDASGELTLPVRTPGAVPQQTATLRLRVEVLP